MMSTEDVGNEMSAKPVAWKCPPYEAELSPQQQAEAIALFKSLTTDLEMDVFDLEHELRLLMEATRSDFLKWEEEAEAVGLPDEFSVPPEVVAVMSPEWRLAYVARLLNDLASSWAGPYWKGRPADEIDEHSPAGFLRRVNDVLES